MPSYRFFFSYASETHRASAWQDWGRLGNHLDEFYDALCRAVALETGQKIEEVGYRDQQRLAVSSFWGPELVNALQCSSVLIAIISPHYLASENCGREIRFFHDRFEQRTNPNGLDRHRIVPIFWMDKNTCAEHMVPRAAELFNALQLRGDGMPNTYPHTGAIRLYKAGDNNARSSLVDVVARVVKDLSGSAQLPQLNGAGDFRDLPSFFTPQDVPVLPAIAVGPRGTNVVYAVATDVEARHRKVGSDDLRGDTPNRWRPFVDSPETTVELATRQGLSKAGQDDSGYRDIGLSGNLTVKLVEAKKANSPVLIVLDRSSLRVPAIEAPLRDYDGRDFPHVGLITAGGQEAELTLVESVMPTKYQQKRPNHLWPLPAGVDQFGQGVVEVIGGLRRCLQQTGATALSLPPGQIPGL